MAAPVTALDTAAVQQLADLVERTVEPAANAAVQAIFEIPAYASNPDPALRDNVAAHCRHVFGALVVALREERPPQAQDFPQTPDSAMRRVEQGITLADFMRAFRVGQASLWAQLRDRLDADPLLRDTALEVVATLMHVIEVGSVAAATAHLEAEQYRLADHDRVRRDLIEDLLAGRLPVTAPRRGLLHAAGLRDGAPFQVVSGVVAGGDEDEDALGAVAATVRREVGRAAGGVLALRQSEFIAVFPVDASTQPNIVAGLERACAELGATALRMRFGLSTTYRRWRDVPAAYQEAVSARRAGGGCPGVVSLSSFSAADYLMMTGDPIARRLVKQAVRRFIEEDGAAGGNFIATALAYAECDLNARMVAERLQVHVNTVYYRLERIAERTGCDMRRYRDVNDLITAIGLLAPRPAAPNGGSGTAPHR